eukprot:746005-Hanusia_phi.AAC.2
MPGPRPLPLLSSITTPATFVFVLVLVLVLDYPLSSHVDEYAAVRGDREVVSTAVQQNSAAFLFAHASIR